LPLTWASLLISLVFALPVQAQYMPLYTAQKAMRVGDLVTIIIQESANAVQKAETSVKKDVTRDFSSGFEFMKGGLDIDFTGGYKDKHKGGGTTSRSTSFNARVTASIIALTPAGNLRLEGHQRVKINDEMQEITVKGVVRPQDIRPDNTVLSSALSDADIVYKGKGSLARKQKPGWMSRLLNWLF